jgi:hypothetical protein
MVKKYFTILALMLAVGGLASSCSRTNPSNSTAHLASAVSSANPGDLKASIIKDSQEGGKLDFFTSIKGHEHEGRQIKPEVYVNGLEFALYNWGRSVKDLGVKTVEEAYDIYSEFKGQAASTRDKETIKLGFYKELDK